MFAFLPWNKLNVISDWLLISWYFKRKMCVGQNKFICPDWIFCIIAIGFLQTKKLKISNSPLLAVICASTLIWGILFCQVFLLNRSLTAQSSGCEMVACLQLSCFASYNVNTFNCICNSVINKLKSYSILDSNTDLSSDWNI